MRDFTIKESQNYKRSNPGQGIKDMTHLSQSQVLNASSILGNLVLQFITVFPLDIVAGGGISLFPGVFSS